MYSWTKLWAFYPLLALKVDSSCISTTKIKLLCNLATMSMSLYWHCLRSAIFPTSSRTFNSSFSKIEEPITHSIQFSKPKFLLRRLEPIIVIIKYLWHTKSPLNALFGILIDMEFPISFDLALCKFTKSVIWASKPIRSITPVGARRCRQGCLGGPK